MITEVRLAQSVNAELPIEVTELGMVTDVSPEQLEKALSPMEVTEYVIPSKVIASGITTLPL